VKQNSQSAEGAFVQLFVVPDERCEPTGSNLVNEGLIRGLCELGVPLERTNLDEAPARMRERELATVWVDSRFFASFPLLREGCPAGVRMNFLAHSLPSLSEYGDEVTRARLTRAERLALQAVHGAWVARAPMASLLARLGAESLKVAVVEPGIEVHPGPVTRAREPMHALMVANLLPGKGVIELLAELAQRLVATDELVLSIVGSTHMDAPYARKVRELIERTPKLRERVVLHGSLPHARVLEMMRAAHVLLSASRLEGYGLALAEARASGLVVLARAGGNVAEWIAPASGGVLAPDDAALAAECVALSRDRALREELLEQAEAAALPPRPWGQVARELMQAVERLGL
jgi:glycosyltransferase involved in cell wall biosynthesis